MGKLRDTKKDFIDAIIAAAAQGRFTRDKRVGDLPAIALEDFQIELFRCGEKELRARLSNLSRAELIDAMQDWADQQITLMERDKREAAAQARIQRQRERARKPRLQRAILAAARHYRGLDMTAKKAWDAIKKTSFKTDDGKTVAIRGPKEDRLKQRMRVISRDERQLRRSIGFDYWRERYWTGAAQPG